MAGQLSIATKPEFIGRGQKRNWHRAVRSIRSERNRLLRLDALELGGKRAARTRVEKAEEATARVGVNAVRVDLTLRITEAFNAAVAGCFVRERSLIGKRLFRCQDGLRLGREADPEGTWR